MQSKFTAVPEQYRQKAKDEAFRFIQLASGAGSQSFQPAPLGPVLRSRFEADLKEYTPTVMAWIIVFDDTSGQFTNSSQMVEVAATHLGEGNILQLDRAMGQMTQPGSDPYAAFPPAPEGGADCPLQQ